MDTARVEHALGVIGTAFRLSRLYHPTHPAVVETMAQMTAMLPSLAALGSVEWKVSATGLHWHGQDILPRNTHLAELAGLLFARGVRAILMNPGVTPENLLALFGVATGTVPPQDLALGRVGLTFGRRSTQRVSAIGTPAEGAPAVSAPPEGGPVAAAPAAAQPIVGLPGGKRASFVFRLDALPIDVEAKRAAVAVAAAESADARRAALEKLAPLASGLLARRDVATVAEVIVALDRVLSKVQEPDLVEAIGAAAAAFAQPVMVDQMVRRLGEPRVPAAEREALLLAVGALAAVSVELVLGAFLTAPAEHRDVYRAAIRHAADRAIEPLRVRLEDAQVPMVAAAAELLGLTGSPQAVPLLVSLIRHEADVVREAALLALAEIGGREIVRPAMPALKDESVPVRLAAARAIAVGGDPAATTVLVRRLDQEEDEGVEAELLRAIGQLGAKEALEVLAKYAEPGGMLKRRQVAVRAAAIEGLTRLAVPEARALLELYSQDKEPMVRQAAEAGLR